VLRAASSFVIAVPVVSEDGRRCCLDLAVDSRDLRAYAQMLVDIIRARRMVEMR
jgi:hypothetical protein